jgi:hypothetical protein
MTVKDWVGCCVKCWEFNPPLNDDDICNDCETDILEESNQHCPTCRCNEEV